MIVVDLFFTLRFLSIQAGQLDFYIKIINDERDQFFKQPNSKDDQYCFEVTFNGGPKSSNVFKDMSKNTHEKHKITNLEMNVPAKKFYTGNLSDGDYSEDDEHSRITAKNLQHPQIDINCKLWTIEAKVDLN